MFTNAIVPVNTQSSTPVYTQARQIVNVANDLAVINNTSSTIGGGSDIQMTRTGNSINFKIRGGTSGATNPITDYHINSWAQIQQSKLLMSTATTTATAWVGTQSQIQARLGLASFDSRMFTATSGWVTLVNSTGTTSGVQTTKQAWVPAPGGLLGATNTAAATAATYVSSSSIKTWLGNESTNWQFASDLDPITDLARDIGAITKRWSNIYANTGTFSAGIASSGTWNGQLIDGVVMDYVTGLARFTTGAADGFNFYNGNTGTRSSLVSIDANGNVLQTGGTLGTQATTLNLFNSTATTVNAFSSATSILMGSTTASTFTMRPGTVVGTNASQDLFNTIATTLNIGSAATTARLGGTSGTLTLGNPIVVGTQAAQQLYNTVATTVNAFQAATTLNIASTGGSTTVFSGLNVKGAAVFDSSVTFNGTATYVLSTNTVYTDNIIDIHNSGTNVAASWTFNDGKDIGIRFNYYDSTDKNAALVLSNSSKFLEFYSNGTESVAGVFTLTSYGVFKTGAIILTSSTNATSKTTGALQVTGGIGAQGDVWATNVTATTAVYAPSINGTTSVNGLAVYDNSNRVITSVTVSAGTGMSGGGTITGPSGTVTLTNNGVTSITAGTGTSVINSAGGASTVWIGQSVATNANVTFNQVSTKYLTAVDAGSGWALVQGTWHLDTGASFQATFADLAEYYSADADYEPGTVLVFGGEAELTVTSISSDSRVAGVVTTNPAYVMNASLEGTRACLALQGRIPVKVIGTVRKGDMLTTSNTPGYAIKAMNPTVGTIIGKALENKDDPGMGVIQVAIGRM
jgi:filamentous hemagglutinin